MRISSGHLRLGSSLTRSLAWLPLGVLFGWLWFSVATFDREDRPYLLGDEATYLMQAQSLAWDFDLEYTPADHKRFALSWGAQPDLILHSSDHGETVTYGKPSFYPLYLAPFVRLSPLFGAVVANSLLFSVASLLSAFALRRRFPVISPLLVAFFVFGSVAFAHVFWAHPDLFLMSLTALALAASFLREEGEGRGGLAGSRAGTFFLGNGRCS